MMQDPGHYNMSDSFTLHEGYINGAEPLEQRMLGPRFNLMVSSFENFEFDCMEHVCRGL